MGGIFSKDKKAKADQARQGIGSAPSRLEGLDGTTPPPKDKRATTPDGTTSRPAQVQGSPSPATTASPEPSGLQGGLTINTVNNDTGMPASPTAETPTRRTPKKIDVVGHQTDGTMLASDLPAAVQVPEEAQHWTAVLGDSVVRNLHSPDWKTREHAIQGVMRSITNAKFQAQHNPADVWKTVTELLAHSLKDKVAPLFHSSLELLGTLAASYCTQLPRDVLEKGLEPVVPTLLHRAGNNNSRIQESAIQALLTLASHPSLGLQFLAPHALSPIPKKSTQGAGAAAHQMAGRLELLTCMLNMEAQQRMGYGQAGLAPGNPLQPRGAPPPASGPSALPAEEVLKFLRPALDMPDDKVRQAAVRLVAELYRRHKTAPPPGGGGFEVEKLLGPGLKPAMLQVLHRRMAEVDEEIKNGGVTAAAGRPGVAGSAPSGSSALDEMPVGSGLSIKASRTPSSLPPLVGRNASALPPLAVVGSRGGVGMGDLGARGPFLGSGGPDSPLIGKPPRTPVTPGGSGVRSRTPPRSAARSTMSAGGDRTGSPASPMRGNSRGSGGNMAPLPGMMADDDNPLMIQSGSNTPVRGNTPGSAGSYSKAGSLKARSKGSITDGPGRVLDDAEEQLIEYILNDEVKDGRH